RELRTRYREIKNDVYFEVLTKNRITEFNRDQRHVRLTNGPIHYSLQPSFDVLENSRTGKNPFERLKSLKEMYQDMKVKEYGEEPAKEGELHYDTLRENINRPVGDEEPDIGYDPQDILNSELPDEEVQEIETLNEGTSEASHGTIEEYAAGAVKATADRKGYGSGAGGFVGDVKMVINDEVVNITPQKLSDMDNKPFYTAMYITDNKDTIKGTGASLALAVKKLAKALLDAGYEGRTDQPEKQ
ncbi:MAG: hypothetical protein LC687_03280, partial [Actinobacteria bacterium]|nr:hypothetical protein [Actinomycetota bacterium]